MLNVASTASPKPFNWLPTVYSMSPKSKDAKTSVQYSKDEKLPASLGYKQELKRDFHWIELMGLRFSNIGVVQSIA